MQEDPRGYPQNQRTSSKQRSKIKQKPVTNALFSLASNTIHPTKPLNPILNLFNCDYAEHKITGARKCLGLESTIVFHFENFTMNMAGDLASTP